MEGEIASLANEALSAMPVVKAFGTERFEGARVERSSSERLTVGVEASRLEARFGVVVDLLGAISTALILGIGVLRVAAGEISPGDLVVFVSYSNRMYRPLREIARQSTRFARAMARLDRIGDVLRSDEVLEERGHHVAARLRGDLTLDDVSFRYAPDRWALQHVTLHVPAGRRVALVGASGAGKSTVGRARGPVLRPDRRGRCCSTAATLATGRWPGSASRSASCCRTRSCSAARSPRTSPTAER